MTSGPEPVGTLDVALAHAEKLLVSEPRLAAEQAREILGAIPNHPAATLLLGLACRRTGAVTGAVQILEPLAASQRAAFATLKERLFAELDRPLGTFASRDGTSRPPGD